MIISCPNCIKKFDVKSSLIHKEGRLVQCISCNHKWFFKRETEPEFIESTRNENLKIFDSIDINQANPSAINDKINKHNKELPKKNYTIKNNKKIKKLNLLSLTSVFIITFTAFILFVDTLQGPISKFVPNINFLLYNLYESINDIILFFRDLI